MKVTITYHDTESLTVEEVVKDATSRYGIGARVDVGPDSSIAYDHIYHGLQQLITHEQLSAFFSKDGTYPHQLQSLRSSIMYKMEEIIDQVIIDNEARIT
jgi:hypothetical protein